MASSRTPYKSAVSAQEQWEYYGELWVSILSSGVVVIFLESDMAAAGFQVTADLHLMHGRGGAEENPSLKRYCFNRFHS